MKKQMKKDSTDNVACQFIIFTYAQRHIHFMHYVIRIKIGPEENNKENKECFSMIRRNRKLAIIICMLAHTHIYKYNLRSK